MTNSKNIHLTIRRRVWGISTYMEHFGVLYRGFRGDSHWLARDSIYAIARYMLSPVRPSVRLSHKGGSVKDG